MGRVVSKPDTGRFLDRKRALELQGNPGAHSGVVFSSVDGGGVVVGPGGCNLPGEHGRDFEIQLSVSSERIVVAVGWVEDGGEGLFEFCILVDGPSEFFGGRDRKVVISDSTDLFEGHPGAGFDA